MSLYEWIINNEKEIRIFFFVSIFMAIALWEIRCPRRNLSISKATRWISNLSLVVLNSIVLRLLFPTAAIGVAAVTNKLEWGIFNYFAISHELAIVLSVVAMDLVIYLQHVMVHAVPVFWRLHQVHHADLDYDVTTGSRFHTLEIILSMLIKFAAIIVLGVSVIAVLIFEILLNVTAMFNHGNIYLPKKVDAILRLFVVTPDMHRVHHSVHPSQSNSNFGFNLPWWDRIFGTYIAQPSEGHKDMHIGLNGLRNPKQVNNLPGMLLLPFKAVAKGYDIKERD